jgi:hypothetical protein
MFPQSEQMLVCQQDNVNVLCSNIMCYMSLQHIIPGHDTGSVQTQLASTLQSPLAPKTTR